MHTAGYNNTFLHFHGILYGFPHGSVVKTLPANAGDTGSIHGQGDPLEKEMATHFSILAWKIPWAEEPGGLQPWGQKESDTTERLSTHAWHSLRDHGSTTPHFILI